MSETLNTPRHGNQAQATQVGVAAGVATTGEPISPMERAKLTDKLLSVRMTLMRTPKFARWSALMMMGKVEVSDTHPTAATNGRDEVYGLTWIRDRNRRELAFTIMHENGHKAARHLLVWDALWRKNPYLANCACDHWLNLQLVELDPVEEYLAFPRDKDGKRIGLYDLRFKGMNTKQIFDTLEQEEKEKQESGKGGGGSGEDTEPFDGHDWEHADGLSEEKKEELTRDVERAMRQGEIAARRAGADPDNSSRLFGELLKPKVDWREQLQQWAQASMRSRDDYSWRRPHRRYIAEDIYLPSPYGTRVRSVAVGADMSGSINRGTVTAFLSEVVAVGNAVRPEELHLMYWDTEVTKHEVYGDIHQPVDSMAQSTRPTGGGGTDPSCMIPYLKKHAIEPECIIILTDGCVFQWGSAWPAPVLWVVVNNPSVTAPIGQTIHID